MSVESAIASPPSRESALIEPLAQDPLVWDELATFLALFVRNGELHDPLP